MRKITLASLALAASIGSLSIRAQAEDCTWNLNGFSIANQISTTTFSCQANGAAVATKTVTVQAKSAPSCALTISNNNLYTNYGTCVAPNIGSTTNPAPGTKVCEFNDPSTGTTPGCTQNSIGGGSGTVAYQVSKNGQPLLVVAKYTQNNVCTISGETASYRIQGNCTNYRVYAK